MRRIVTVALIAAWVVAGAMALYAQSYPQQPYPQENYPQQNYPQPYPQQPASTIPAGTNITIRTNQAINGQQAQAGTQYPAQIAHDVVDANGVVLIPNGSPAMLTIADTGKGVLGGKELALALQSVTANGRTYTVSSNTQQQSAKSGIGANKRTAVYVGGGALLGTLVGAVAGGGKGAAIGAVLGGAGGAATQVLTRGKQINVPAESLLTFKLDQPLQLY